MPVAISVLGRVSELARWTWCASVLSRGWKRRWAWARRVQAGRYREANVVLGEALKLVRLLKTRALNGSVFHSLFHTRTEAEFFFVDPSLGLRASKTGSKMGSYSQ